MNARSTDERPSESHNRTLHCKITKNFWYTKNNLLQSVFSELQSELNISNKLFFYSVVPTEETFFKKATTIDNTMPPAVVSNYKDTNFWKQFTTDVVIIENKIVLFQTTKIQIFESNSQLRWSGKRVVLGCFKLQRYKFLKAIHNAMEISILLHQVVSNYKDTNFWKQFTTICIFGANFGGVVSDYKDTNFLKAIHNKS